MSKNSRYIIHSLFSGAVLYFLLINCFLLIENNVIRIIGISILDFLYLVLFAAFVYIYFTEKNYRNQMLYNRIFINELTGLPNRTRLIEILNEEPGKSYSAVLFDINNFRYINNYFGPQIADKVIVNVGEYINSGLKSSMRLYKFPGDEFFVLCNNSKKRQIENFVKKIINDITQRIYEIEGYEMSVSIRAGIAFSIIDYKELFAKVNISCNLAKHGYHGYHIYDPEINLSENFQKNLDCLGNLREAIYKNNIIPFYQPIIKTKNGKIEKYEALARMVGKNGKITEPDEFLPVSETAMLYPVVTKRIIGKALKQFKNRNEEISLNFTIRDFKNTEIIDSLISAVSKYNMEKRVVIEIVENESISKNKNVLDVIKRLKRNGIKIAIDDFGSGFSNFNYLLQLQADYIKIDGSLIRGILINFESRIIVESIVAFAHRLGIKVIAEYVENEKIFNLMKDFNVDYCQGHYFGKAAKEVK